MPVPRNVQNVGDINNPPGPEAWFKSLPIITRYWFGATFATTLAVNFKIISVGQVFYDWSLVMNKLELWRVLSSFLYIGSFEFNTLIALMLLVQFSQRYEQMGPINTGAGGGTADYCVRFRLVVRSFALYCS